jgi:hypothetical protein
VQQQGFFPHHHVVLRKKACHYAASPNLQRAERETMSEKKAMISQLRGKFQALGVLFIATGVITSVAGGLWWGPAIMFPGILLLIIGWF